MNITRRRGAIAFFITLGVLLTGLTITLNIAWIVHNKEHVVVLVLGIILFAVLVAGVVLNTVFLVREIRRNERQDSFLNAVTHELKTPIASIRLYLETLQRRPIDEPSARSSTRSCSPTPTASSPPSSRSSKPDNSASATASRTAPSSTSRSLVADCIAITLQRHHLPPDSIILEPIPGAVRLHTLGIAEDLRTAVINVLDNAVKYSPEGVHVRCSLAIFHYTWVALTITDTGVGLAPNQFKRIFKRFYRVPGRSTAKIKGTGLGLFLVRNIARQHGGDATATSPGPDLGTTITLTLPLANPTEASPIL